MGKHDTGHDPPRGPRAVVHRFRDRSNRLSPVASMSGRQAVSSLRNGGGGRGERSRGTDSRSHPDLYSGARREAEAWGAGPAPRRRRRRRRGAWLRRRFGRAARPRPARAPACPGASPCISSQSQRVGERGALDEHPAGVGRAAGLAQPALQHQHLVDPLDVAPGERQHAEVEAGLAVVLHPGRPAAGREPQRDDQAAEQDRRWSERRRRRRSCGRYASSRASDAQSSSPRLAVQHVAHRLEQPDAVQRRGTCARRRPTGGSCSTPRPAARAPPWRCRRRSARDRVERPADRS